MRRLPAGRRSAAQVRESAPVPLIGLPSRWRSPARPTRIGPHKCGAVSRHIGVARHLYMYVEDKIEMVRRRDAKRPFSIDSVEKSEVDHRREFARMTVRSPISTDCPQKSTTDVLD